MIGDVHLTDLLTDLIHTMLESIRFFVVLNGRRAVGDDNETDYHRKVYWHRCCSTSIPTTSPYTPTLAASSTQQTCASRRKGNEFNNNEASLTSALIIRTTYYGTNQLRANPSDSQTQQHQCIWSSTLSELCAIKRTSMRQR